MKFFASYLRQRRKGILVFFLFCGIFLCAFLLYHLPAGAVLYPAFLCILLGIMFLAADFIRVRRLHQQLTELQEQSAAIMETFPPADTMEAEDYQEIIRALRREQRQLKDRMNDRISDMTDYYTVWAHQIKTPIASMRLYIRNEDSELSRKVSEELFRIEQYVEMVLCYLRLDSDSTDYVIREYDLDSIVRQAVKRFAGQFIRRKIRLEYKPLGVSVLTDEKWLLFVLEQVLSNALKYTEQGGITIGLEEGKVLYIQDTGIGIAPEDLPRIFEKGYTGYNGRSDKKASGIGLYLCRRICQNMGHIITADSLPDHGTIVRIHLENRSLEIE